MKHLNKKLMLQVVLFLLLEFFAIVVLLFFTPPFGRNIPYSGVYLNTLVPFRDKVRTSNYTSKQKNDNGLTVYYYANSTNSMLYEIETLNDNIYLLRYTHVPVDENVEKIYVNTTFRIASSKLEILHEENWQTPWVYINEIDPFETVIYLSVEAVATQLRLPILISVSLILGLLSIAIIPLSKSSRFKSVRIVLFCICVLVNLLWSARFLL